MRLWRFKSGSDTIIKFCYALLRSVKLCYALENVAIADFMPLLIQSLYKDAEDPQNHCIFNSRTRWQNNKIQKFQMYQSMIYLKKTWCLYPCGGILGERERAWGSLPSVTKPLYSWESMRVLRQSVTKRVRAWWKRLTSCQIFKPDRNKSWDILTKRVKWWQTMKTWVPALNQALLSFPTHWVKLCWDLLRFVKLWYALGALINSWQSVQNF